MIDEIADAPSENISGTEPAVSVDDLAKLQETLQRRSAELAESRTRENSERKARLEAERNAYHARHSATSAEEVAIHNALTAAEESCARIEDAIARADITTPEGRAIFTKMTGELSKARFQQEKYSSQKADYERRQRTQPQQQEPQDPLGAYSPATRSWLEAHPQFFSDKEYYYDVLRAHEGAVKKGIAVDSPAYFEHIETRIGERQEPVAEPEEEAPRRQPSAASKAAPPQRSTPRSEGRTTKNRLSPAEIEAAQASFPDVPLEEAIDIYEAAQRKLLDEGVIKRWN